MCIKWPSIHSPQPRTAGAACPVAPFPPPSLPLQPNTDVDEAALLRRLLALAWPLCQEQVLTYGAYLISMSAVGRLGAYPLSVFVMASAVTNVTGARAQQA